MGPKRGVCGFSHIWACMVLIQHAVQGDLDLGKIVVITGVLERGGVQFRKMAGFRVVTPKD